MKNKMEKEDKINKDMSTAIFVISIITIIFLVALVLKAILTDILLLL